jgi:putative spermidine/putrescine transport system permease protein
MSFTGSVSERSRSFLKRPSASSLRILLLLPCLLFIGIVFIWPILSMLGRGVYSPEIQENLPQTAAAIAEWDGADLPPRQVELALVSDLEHATRRGVAASGRRLSYEITDYRTLLSKTWRAVRKMDGTQVPPLDEIDERWGDIKYWSAFARVAPVLTPDYLLKAVDLKRTDLGIQAVPDDQALFLRVLGRTLWISGVVTGICLLFGFPVAFTISTASEKWKNILLLLVLLPFWTSLLVRTSAWVVLLQDNGIINSLLISVGIIDEPVQMIFNRLGVYIAFVHVMLPFMVLPIYSVLVGISKDYSRASFSLGAGPWRTFFQVYLPLAWPGVWSGCLLTFVIVVGYYITPLLVGGSQDQMTSYFVAFYTTETVNWGLASALAIALALCVLIFVVVASQLGRVTSIRAKG